MLDQNNNHLGQFFCIEGPDGSGKSTQLALLKERLLADGYDVVVTHEPGGTPIGQQIRTIFLENQGKLDPMSEVMLLVAAKLQLLRNVIFPALRAGKIVLTDRFNVSLMAYQGGGRQLGMEAVRRVIAAAGVDFVPAMTIYIDTPLQICRERIAMRDPGSNNAIDYLPMEYHKRVYDSYKKSIQHADFAGLPHMTVAGECDALTLHQQILAEVKRRIT